MTLVPTPRTDKNGVTVIRHMKPEATAAPEKKHIPSPSVATGSHKERWVERQELRDRIFVLVQQPDGMGPSRPEKLQLTLSTIHNSAYLQRALEVALAVKESSSNFGENRNWKNNDHDWHALADNLKNCDVIEVGYRNLDLIRKADRIENGFLHIIQLHKVLLSTTEGYSGENLDMHVSAYNNVRKHRSYGEDFRYPKKYAEDYAPLMMKYPDHWEQLCAYLKDRGGSESFNEAGFRDYLESTQVIAEGVL